MSHHIHICGNNATSFVAAGFLWVCMLVGATVASCGGVYLCALAVRYASAEVLFCFGFTRDFIEFLNCKVVAKQRKKEVADEVR